MLARRLQMHRYRRAEQQDKRKNKQMKNNIIKSLASFALMVGLAATVQATQITGSLDLKGNATLDNTSLLAAKAVNTFANVTAAGPGTLSYSGIADGTSVSMPNALVWNPITVPVSSLWTLTVSGVTYSFDLLTLNADFQGGKAPNLSGTGTLKITGFADTPGVFSFSIASSAGSSENATFGFSASNSAQ